MFDEITLRTFSRLAYFRERPYPYYNESEFNELNIYLSIACGEDQERRREARSAIGLIPLIGEAFFKKWELRIIESSVWAVSESGVEKVKLYDFDTEAVRGALLEKTEGRRNPLTKRICDFLSKESFSEENLLLLILSAFFEKYGVGFAARPFSTLEFEKFSSLAPKGRRRHSFRYC